MNKRNKKINRWLKMLKSNLKYFKKCVFINNFILFFKKKKRWKKQ